MNLSLDARSERFLANLDRINDLQNKVQQQISSGYRVTNPSDGPEHVIDILVLQSDVQRATAIGNNIDRVEAEVNTAESAIQVAVSLLEHVKTLAAQTATATAQNRKDVATEVKGIHQQLIDLTKTMSEGRFVFGGDMDQSIPYTSDWTQPGGVIRETQPQNTRTLEDVNGSRFSVSRSAGEIFDTRNPDDTFANDNVFNAVYQLGKALENDDPDAVTTASALVSAALDHMGRQLTFYGNVQNRVTNARTLTKTAIIARSQELSIARDTDLPSAAIELAQLKVHHEAALGAQAQQTRTSLFDYLG